MNTNTDEIEIYFDKDSSTSYLESLAKCRAILISSGGLYCDELTAGVNEVIKLEIELSLITMQKAKSDLLKANAKDNIKPIKGV